MIPSGTFLKSPRHSAKRVLMINVNLLEAFIRLKKSLSGGRFRMSWLKIGHIHVSTGQVDYQKKEKENS